MFKIEIRTTCKICTKPIAKGFRSYCCVKCRTKATSIRWREYNKKWQQAKRGEWGANKRQCLICKNWYIQVGSHLFSAHKISPAEYKQEFDLPLGAGIVPKWYREFKGQQALDNGTYKNLEAGKKDRFTKGDKRAIEKRGWKGRKGSKGYEFENG